MTAHLDLRYPSLDIVPGRTTLRSRRRRRPQWRTSFFCSASSCTRDCDASPGRRRADCRSSASRAISPSCIRPRPRRRRGRPNTRTPPLSPYNLPRNRDPSIEACPGPRRPPARRRTVPSSWGTRNRTCPPPSPCTRLGPGGIPRPSGTLVSHLAMPGSSDRRPSKSRPSTPPPPIRRWRIPGLCRRAAGIPRGRYRAGRRDLYRAPPALWGISFARSDVDGRENICPANVTEYMY